RQSSWPRASLQEFPSLVKGMFGCVPVEVNDETVPARYAILHALPTDFLSKRKQRVEACVNARL
ncbi:MAG: hypothetical protein ACOY7J_15000, partial [Pseudomonadota bacterium]